MNAQAKKKPEGKKSGETRNRILEAALAVFRERGFHPATMREIAARAGVALGGAYYYFDSKNAIVMAFYERSQSEMAPEALRRLEGCKTLEERLRALISLKLEYFENNRSLLGALSAHADPQHPLSPFSEKTAAIREEDISLFDRAVADSEVKLPARIAPYLPRLLWLYQMGLILFWVYDSSEGQRRTAVLYDKSLRMVMMILRFARLSLLLPIHGLAADLLESVYGMETRPKEEQEVEV